MKHIHTFEQFVNETTVARITPGSKITSVSGKFIVTIDGKKYETEFDGFEKEGNVLNLLYVMDEDPLKAKCGTLSINKTDQGKLQNYGTVKGTCSTDGKEVTLKKLND